MHLLLLVAKGQRKNNVFRCLCVHHMLAPWSTSNSREDCGRHTACSVLQWLPRASSLPGLAKDREAMPPFTTGELALWKRQGMKEGHCCLATPRGVPSCPPMGLWSSGSGRTSHSVPGPRGQLRVVPGTSVFRIRLDTQDGMQFLRGEPQQVLQVTYEAVHVAFA